MNEDLISDKFFSVDQLKQIVVNHRSKESYDCIDTQNDLIKALVVESAELLDLITFDFDGKSNDYNVKQELADVLIYGFALANHMNWDVCKLINNKIKYNEERGRKYNKG